MKTRDKVRRLLAKGDSPARIAARLGVSDAAVRNHLAAIGQETAPDCRVAFEDYRRGRGCGRCPTCVAREAVLAKTRPASGL